MTSQSKEKRRASYEKNKERETEKMKEYSLKNKGKINSYKKSWASKNREKTLLVKRVSQLKRNFGISLEEYDKLLKEQGGLCAICRLTCITGRNLCVDHNHSTGKVRGLLCFKCNTTIGRFKDDMKVVLNAFNYLLKYA